MHLHLPKPLHGWREFAGEVGIIVIGVLIALGAEQVVERLHSHRQVRDATKALNQELAFNYGSVMFRHHVDRCVTDKLAQMQLWMAAHRNRQSEPFPPGVGRPTSLAILSSVWDVVKSGQVAAKMPLNRQLQYAQLYDVLANFSRLEQMERDVWFDINDFPGLRLNDRDVARLHGLMMREQVIQGAFGDNYPFLARDFRNLGITPVELQPNAGATSRKALCGPLAG